MYKIIYLNCIINELIIYDLYGYRIIDADNLEKGKELNLYEDKYKTVYSKLENLRLKEGIYIVGLWLGIINEHVVDYIENLGTADVVPGNEEEKYSNTFPGAYNCKFDCEIFNN